MDGVSGLITQSMKLNSGGRDRIEQVQSLPPMTDAVTPSGHVISTTNLYFGLNPYYAFDGIIGGGLSWFTDLLDSGDGLHYTALYPSSLMRELPRPFKIGAYAITANSGGVNLGPKTFSIYGSQDGLAFTLLDRRVNEPVWLASETRRYTLAKPFRAPYRFFELSVEAGHVTSGDGTDAVYINELQLFQVI